MYVYIFPCISGQTDLLNNVLISPPRRRLGPIKILSVASGNKGNMKIEGVKMDVLHVLLCIGRVCSASVPYSLVCYVVFESPNKADIMLSVRNVPI